MLKRWQIVSGLGALLVVDRLIKYLAQHHFQLHWWIFQFGYFPNHGIIFSWPLPGTIASVLMLAGLGFVAYLFYKHWIGGHQLKLMAAGLMLVGAVSNTFDRIAYGAVTDWAYFGRWWPIFNLADLAITVGLVLFLTAEQKPVS